MAICASTCGQLSKRVIAVLAVALPLILVLVLFDWSRTLHTTLLKERDEHFKSVTSLKSELIKALASTADSDDKLKATRNDLTACGVHLLSERTAGNHSRNAADLCQKHQAEHERLLYEREGIIRKLLTFQCVNLTEMEVFLTENKISTWQDPDEVKPLTNDQNKAAGPAAQDMPKIVEIKPPAAQPKPKKPNPTKKTESSAKQKKP